ncbi:MAG TPA: hypothetical protein VG370_29820 [Chloroflexota bacterium]|nr:hypothetical protein [Chloroflexota bacterium]
METARDIAIVVLAVINIVWLLILCAIGFVLLRLFLQVKGKVPEVMDTATSTARTVKGTTEFVGESVVTPVIRIAALMAGLSKFLSVLFGGERRRV